VTAEEMQNRAIEIIDQAEATLIAVAERNRASANEHSGHPPAADPFARRDPENRVTPPSHPASRLVTCNGGFPAIPPSTEN
jgi:hypothetical protein